MGKPALLILLLLLITCSCVRLDGINSTRCVEEERQALLTLKHSFRGPYTQRLLSWQGHDCCGWDGVSCDKSTGHVLKLDLRAPAYKFFSWESLEAKEVNYSLMKLKYLKHLDLSGNDFNFSSIPQFLGQMKELTYLNLSSACLGGRVPHHLGNLSNLEFLDLSGYENNLYVDDFSWASGLLSLQHLDMRVNLSTLDLGGNRLSGSLPTWIGESLSYLQILNLRNNSFSGTISPHLCLLSHLQIMDLANNDLHGSIPICLGNLTSMTSTFVPTPPPLLSKYYPLPLLIYNSPPPPPLHYDEWNKSNIRQVLKGRELEYTSVLKYVVNMDLSGNRLNGSIPQGLMRLSRLVGLNLAYNQLSGSIPNNIGDLRLLLSLDLSHNQLSGEIPSTLSALTSLSYLNLSSNNLEGQIPHGNQLQTLDDPSIYEGNPRLCGPPLPQACPGNNPTSKYGGDVKNEDKDGDLEKMWFYIVVMAGYATGLWGVVVVLLVKKRRRHSYFMYVDEIKDNMYVAVAVKMGALKQKMRKKKATHPQ